MQAKRGHDCSARVQLGNAGSLTATMGLCDSAGDQDQLAEILQAGANADERDEESRTALHFACGYGELECAAVRLSAYFTICLFGIPIDKSARVAQHLFATCATTYARRISGFCLSCLTSFHSCLSPCDILAISYLSLLSSYVITGCFLESLKIW